jgi:tetratricopeptide (TPR) repeat protein
VTQRIPRPRLRRARLRLGWSKERAADEIARRFPHLCIDARQIGRWEAGETRTPRPMNVLALSTTYGLPPEELDLPSVPGADPNWSVPRAVTEEEQAPAPPLRTSPRSDLRVQACSTDGEFVTLVVHRRDLVQALGGAVATGVDDSEARAEHGAPALRPQLSTAESAALSQTIGRNIEAAWALFHSADTEHMLAVARAQLSMLRRHHADLHPAVLASFHSAAYRLLGATHHLRGRHEEALRAHHIAYLAALGGGDAWNMAESRSWQAYGLQSLGRDAESLQLIDCALRLISDQSDHASIRLRARLLACGAVNAATLHYAERAAAMLYASEGLLSELPGLHEEFDRVAWLADAGMCSLRLGQTDLAITRLQQASNETPPRWIARHLSATIALAEAFAEGRDREATLAAAKWALSQLHALHSRELSGRLVHVLDAALTKSFPDDRQCLALIGEAQRTFEADA